RNITSRRIWRGSIALWLFLNSLGDARLPNHSTSRSNRCGPEGKDLKATTALRWRCLDWGFLRLFPPRSLRCASPSSCPVWSQQLNEPLMNNDKYPALVPCSRPLQFEIGKDSRGNWVVQDDQRLCGGLFIDRTTALRFAMLENGSRPQAVVMVPGIFELDVNGTGRAEKTV